MKTKGVILALLAVTAGVVAYTRPHNAVLLDLRDAVADKGFDTSIPSFEKGAGNIPEPKAVAVEAEGKLYVAGYPADGIPGRPVEWVSIRGGRFLMGADDMPGCEEARPVHEVNIRTFEMSRTLVTVEQYAECVIRGKCALPGNDKNSNNGANCNWGKDGRQFHPVNCVTWDQAKRYAQFMRARLPSEAEWEYAATGGGKRQKYPWGDDAPTCARAVMDDGGYGCGNNGTMPVCSRPLGNTAQGVCDMAGNVWQWTQDTIRNSYVDAPTDGSADESVKYVNADGTKTRVIRGGSFYTVGKSELRAQFRNGFKPLDRADHTGFRIVRSH